MPSLIWIAILIELIRVAPLNFSFLFLLQFANGLVWYYEEKNSNEAIESLKRSLAPKAKVKRDGIWKIIEARMLVLGDRIFIGAGDLLPADCILGPGECSIDQSMLTGETTAVLKTEGGKVYMGSICKKGEIEAFVSGIGKNTFFGKNAFIITEVHQKGKVIKVLTKIAFLLMIISSVLVSVIFIVLLIKGNEFLESLAVCAVLLVISLPIAMQVVCATTLAVGAKSLNKKQAVVSRLSSIEELAKLEVLCIGKSGFLTKNEPIVQDPILIQSKNIEEIFLAALLESRRESESQNSIDRCICDFAIEKLKLDTKIYEEEDFIPYNAKIKRSTSTVRNTKTGEIIRSCKGAPQVVLALTEQWNLEGQVSNAVVKLASQGYSSLAVAKTDSTESWQFLGLIPLLDPMCQDTLESVKRLKEINVKIMMLAGDQIAITKQLCIELNLGDRIFNAEIFNHDNTSVQREFIDMILLSADGYAEVYPEHKFTLVKMLQRKKKKVGVTGKSISDAPALKRANVGLAAHGATDAAMAASDIIFHKAGLLTVIQSIIRARKIFHRSETYCIYRLSCSFQLLLFFFICVVAINPSTNPCSKHENCNTIPNTAALPVLTLVIIALLNDGTIISIAYDKPSISKEPKSWNLTIIFTIACVLGSISFFSSLAFLLLGLNHMDSNQPNPLFDLMTIPSLSYGEVLASIFMKISISNYLTIFSVRCKGFFFMSLPGKALLLTGITSIAVTTLLCKYWYLNLQPKNSVIVANLSPISWKIILLIFTYDITVFIIQDIAKIIVYKAFSSHFLIKQDEVLIKMSLNEVCSNYYKSYSVNILTNRSNFAACAN